MSTIIGGSHDPVRRFTITVTMDAAGSDVLMRLVSVLHRRQIEILRSTYERVASTAWMTADVETTDARVRTTVLTLRNTVGVTGCEAAPSRDDRHEIADEGARAPELHHVG